MKVSFPKWYVNGNEKLKELCDSNFPPEAVDLLTQMMHLEPSKRITVKAAMDHPFFKDHGSSKVGTTLPMISPVKKVRKV